MKKIIAVLSVFIVSFSCKKFVHENKVPEKCEMCAFAESLEGTYYGLAQGVQVGQFANGSSDSLRVTVDHIFTDQGAYYDSTVMRFKLTYDYQSSPQNFVSYIEFRNGQFKERYSLSPLVFREFHSYISHYDLQVHIAMDYTGIRE